MHAPALNETKTNSRMPGKIRMSLYQLDTAAGKSFR